MLYIISAGYDSTSDRISAIQDAALEPRRTPLTRNAKFRRTPTRSSVQEDARNQQMPPAHP